MGYNKGNVKTILEPPKLQMQYDMFAYMPPSGGGVTVYEFGKPKPIRTIDLPYHSYKDVEKILEVNWSFIGLFTRVWVVGGFLM